MRKKVLCMLLAIGVSSPVLSAEKSLYEKLGGKQAIDAVVIELTNKMAKDPLLKKYCANMSKERIEANRALVANFICKATGGPCEYNGRDMKSAHAGLGINEKEWKRFVKLTEETLKQFKVAPEVRKEFLSAVAPLKEQIVSKR